MSTNTFSFKLGAISALGLMAALLSPLAHAVEHDVQALLKAADRYRTGGEALQVETQVQTVKADGSADKERRYTVFVQPGHQSLVLMRSPAEAGQKVLMLGDDFWLLMPGSQRPVRITPAQKLLGDASTGDIATLAWAEDYTGSVIGEEPCADGANPAPAGAPATCLHLSLQARRKGLSYQRIELWIGRQRHEPVRAELYVQSDKLAKLARFTMDQPATPTLVAEMRLTDQLSSHKATQVRYLQRQARKVPENWLNPMFLARNPQLD